MARDHDDTGKKDSGFHGKKGLTVQVYNNNINKALSQLKKRVATEGIAKELRMRQNFESNTSKRRRAMAEAAGRWRKKQAQVDGVPANKKKPRDPGS